MTTNSRKTRASSWFTRLWWAFWKWLRPRASKRRHAVVRPELQVVTRSAVNKRMAEQILESQQHVVEELRRLSEILDRSGASLPHSPVRSLRRNRKRAKKPGLPLRLLPNPE